MSRIVDGRVVWYLLISERSQDRNLDLEKFSFLIHCDLTGSVMGSEVSGCGLSSQIMMWRCNGAIGLSDLTGSPVAGSILSAHFHK